MAKINHYSELFEKTTNALPSITANMAEFLEAFRIGSVPGSIKLTPQTAARKAGAWHLDFYHKEKLVPLARLMIAVSELPKKEGCAVSLLMYNDEDDHPKTMALGDVKVRMAMRSSGQDCMGSFERVGQTGKFDGYAKYHVDRFNDLDVRGLAKFFMNLVESLNNEDFDRPISPQKHYSTEAVRKKAS